MAEKDEILLRLDSLIRLLCIHIVRDLTQKEQVSLLARAGFQPKAIADLIGTTPNTVSVTLSDLRRQKESKRGGKKS